MVIWIVSWICVGYVNPPPLLRGAPGAALVSAKEQTAATDRGRQRSG
jgi:hypothetical protein